VCATHVFKSIFWGESCLMILGDGGVRKKRLKECYLL